ncbi:MAG: alanine racemase, partial [Raoultibacter sp.]
MRYTRPDKEKGQAVSQIPNEIKDILSHQNLKVAADFARDSLSPAESPGFDPEKLATIPAQDRRWAWIEVDLSAIRHNMTIARQAVGRGKRIMAVVKADAYGHGAVKVAKTALNSGADYLGVATVDEAIELREALVNAPILLLAQPPITAIPLLIAYKIMPTIYTPDFAIQYGEAADSFGVRAPFHLKVNTGMNRIGVRYDSVVDFMTQI